MSRSRSLIMSKGKKDKDNDLTRIEHLSEFLHEEDTELDSIFKNFNSQNENESDESLVMNLEDLDEDLPPALPENTDQADFTSENPEEINDETPYESSEEFSLDSTNDNFDSDSLDFSLENNQDENLEENLEEDQDVNQYEQNFEETLEETLGEISEKNSEETLEANLNFNSENYTEDYLENDTQDNTDTPQTNLHPEIREYESLNEVKTFAKEFSYGKANIGSGHPPFSIIARNVKYEEDAEDIRILLKEFGILNEENKNDYETSLKLGSVLISHISEYVAIVLAHKLRRFDLDLEFGLSDEIHISKSAEANSRGLIKKESLKQNKKEQLSLSTQDFSIKDIIATTASSLSLYKIIDYQGVHTTMTIIDEEDFEKLQFVDKSLRSTDENEIIDFNLEELGPESSLASFKSYQKSFTYIFDELIMRLKQKAFTMNSNALLSITFQINPIHFEKNYTKSNSYQIICSATFATIKKE